jgi:hypothetical protein
VQQDSSAGTQVLTNQNNYTATNSKLNLTIRLQNRKKGMLVTNRKSNNTQKRKEKKKKKK